MGKIGSTEIILLVFFIIPLIVLPLVAIVEILKSDFKDGSAKLLWFIVVFFVPLLGWILYFTMGRKQRDIK